MGPTRHEAAGSVLAASPHVVPTEHTGIVSAHTGGQRDIGRGRDPERI